MKTSIPFLAVTAFLLCACVEPQVRPPRADAQIDESSPGTLSILSNPPGAFIQVNGKSVGKAPCTAEIPVFQSNGKWILQENVTVTALPTREGEFLETKLFDRFTAPPKQVAFDFLKRPGKTGHSGPEDDEEFSNDWDRVTGGRSHELNTPQ